MMASRYVLDTNILAALLKKEATTARSVEQALSADAEFLMCPVVFHELYRGLLHRDAKRQYDFFLQLTATFVWDDLTREDWEKAAQIWALLRRGGHPIEDADLLIGTFALRRNAVVVTDNVRHFTPLGVPVENWRR